MEGDGAEMFERARKIGLEGIVSKHKAAPYSAGKCKNRVKVKNPSAPAMFRMTKTGRATAGRVSQRMMRGATLGFSAFSR
jgi:ATP-dependent DNA ligase